MHKELLFNSSCWCSNIILDLQICDIYYDLKEPILAKWLFLLTDLIVFDFFRCHEELLVFRIALDESSVLCLIKAKFMFD